MQKPIQMYQGLGLFASICFSIALFANILSNPVPIYEKNIFNNIFVLFILLSVLFSQLTIVYYYKGKIQKLNFKFKTRK